MNESCKTESVMLQENGIVRNSQGQIIGHLVEDIDSMCGEHNKRGYKHGYRAGSLDEREECAKRAEIALLGTLKATSDRVLMAIRNTSQS